ncbi:DedA family protein [Aeromicrobium sp. P5_D10]
MTALVLTLGLGLALAFAESGLGLGIFVPGETVVVVLAASMGSPLHTCLLGLAVMIGACMGDHVGFLLGRRYGEALRETSLVRRIGQQHYDRATGLLRRRGGAAIFLTRLVPVVRTVTPAVAGASGLAYRRFVSASLAGSMLWATVYVGGGSLAAAVLSVAGRASWLIVVLIAAVFLPLLVVRTVIGVRPTRAAPDVTSLELATGVLPRRPTFMALVGETRI